MAPTAKLRKVASGMISMPASAIATAMPEKKTVRLAVAPAVAMASIFSRPRPRSSRKRWTMKSE